MEKLVSRNAPHSN